MNFASLDFSLLKLVYFGYTLITRLRYWYADSRLTLYLMFLTREGLLRLMDYW